MRILPPKNQRIFVSLADVNRTMVSTAVCAAMSDHMHLHCEQECIQLGVSDLNFRYFPWFVSWNLCQSSDSFQLTAACFSVLTTKLVKVKTGRSSRRPFG